MFRILVSLFLSLLLVGISGPVEALTPRSIHVTVTGVLEWREGPGVPHYAVSDHILITGGTAVLRSLVGAVVTVQGEEFAGPTSFMQKAIVVDKITGSPAQPSSPSTGTPPISTPVVPDPAVSPPPRGGSRISIPEPPPLVGSSHVLLFGRIVRIGDHFYVRDPLAETGTGTAIVSGEVRLEDLEGEVAGLVASPDQPTDGRKVYRILHAIVLTWDLGDVVHKGESLIYLPPHGEITILLRGRKLQLDQGPIMGNGRTLLHLRSIAEGLGAQVAWDQQTRTATARLGGREVAVTVGSNRVIVREEGQPDRILTVDISPVIAGGRTMVPARVISEGLGLSISWDPGSRTVSVH